MDTKADHVDWKSFWDLGTPKDAARAFIELYESRAIDAAQECVRTATADNRDEDARFWKAVVVLLRNS